MNNHIKGYLRDKAIVEAITEHRCLDTEQIYLLLFKSKKSGLRIAQRRLKRLYEKGELKRVRESIEKPYWYYVENKPEQMEHRIATNWVYIWFLNNLASWEELYCFKYEQDYGLLRADALVGIKNRVLNKYRFYFIEVDLSNNNFDKVQRYNNLYEREHNWWWVSMTDRFPPILIVTTHKNRYNAILDKIKKENRNGLEFRVYYLHDIKRRCLL